MTETHIHAKRQVCVSMVEETEGVADMTAYGVGVNRAGSWVALGAIEQCNDGCCIGAPAMHSKRRTVCGKVYQVGR